MITPYLPFPLHSGGQTRSYNLIKYLSEEHEITLFSFIRDVKENKYVKELTPFCQKIKTFQRGPTWSPKKIFKSAFSLHPFLICNYLNKDLRKAITAEIKKEDFDLIHTECFYLMPNIPKTNLPKILVDQTIEYAVYRHYTQTLPWWKAPLKPIFYLDVLKIFLWERFYWKTADQTCAVSEDDQALMKKFCPNTDIKVVRNGVDVEKFNQKSYPREKKPTILFGVANFKWMQNTEAAQILLDKLWPKIQDKVADARMWVIGRHAKEYFSKYDRRKNITVQEAEKVPPYYQKPWFLLAPIRSGGGSRTKFFEAMASGLPVITTPAGIEGIKAQDGKEVLIGENNTKLIDHCLDLINHPEKIEKIGRAGQKLVQNFYSWRQSAEKLGKIYREKTQNSPPKAGGPRAQKPKNKNSKF